MGMGRTELCDHLYNFSIMIVCFILVFDFVGRNGLFGVCSARKREPKNLHQIADIKHTCCRLRKKNVYIFSFFDH